MSKKEGDNRAISLLTNDEFPLPPIKCGWLIDTHRCQVELKFCTQTHAYTRKIGALLPVRWSLVGSFFRPAPRPGNENSAAPSLRVSTEHVCNERQRRNFHNQWENFWLIFLEAPMSNSCTNTFNVIVDDVLGGGWWTIDTPLSGTWGKWRRVT
jgi:hypothetical protein